MAHKLRITVFIILLFIPFVGAFCDVDASTPNSSSNFSYDIQSHSLTVAIDPSQHTLKGKDELEVHFRGKRGPVSFLLNSKLRVSEIINSKTSQPVSWVEVPYSDTVRKIEVSLPNRRSSLTIVYEGPIYDPIVKEKVLQFVRGDQTSGLIGTEGTYLSTSSHWYPDKPDSISLFDIEVTIPAPFRVVTQGELVSEELKGGSWKTRWSDVLPAEGLTLVAGKYSVRTKTAGAIKISTYFFSEDDKFSDLFLNAAEDYLKIYSDLLGPYPFKKFDIVQNFFSSGYGLPTFTLLAPEVIRQGKEFLRPGALDHEVVHSWWGHLVMGKPGTGNWVRLS